MLFKTLSISEKVVRIAASGLAGGMLLSWPLWNEAARVSFPMFPVWGGATHRQDLAWISNIVPFVALFFLFAAGIFPKIKFLPAAAAASLLGLCCLDLNRLQPWVWFYLLVFSAVIAHKKAHAVQTITALRWLLAGVYFWSGFNKLTPYFAEDNFAWFCEAFSFTKPLGRAPLLGYTVAALEMFFGLGLLWEKTRSYFRWLVMGLHSVIIVFLLKMEWNWVVIPWNVAMAGMAWTLNPASEKKEDTRSDSFRSTEGPMPSHSSMAFKPGGFVIIGFAWFAPALHFFGAWPYNLSWQLYTNTQTEVTFYAKTGLPCASLSEIWKNHAFDDGTKLLLDDWATDELKVPMFASESTISEMGKYLCRCNSNPDSAGIYILTVNRWNKSAESLRKIPCAVQR